MELHAPNRKLLMADAHDFALLSLGGEFQAVGQGIALNDERVIAGGGEGIGHALEQILPVVLNERSFAVHHAVVDDNISAEHVPDALMAER